MRVQHEKKKSVDTLVIVTIIIEKSRKAEKKKGETGKQGKRERERDTRAAAIIIISGSHRFHGVR